jgi:hypothetical protein
MCWVPKWFLIIGKSQHNKDAVLLDGAKRVRRLFKGSRVRLSTRAKRTIAVYSLAAAGASDWGVQSVIFGVLKAITDEMNLKLTPEEHGTPSIRTLANWEFDLATGCMATIISQIILDGKRMMEKYGKKLQITLVTDHGNRRGVDHFVKMICWSSIDDKGKHILRHFNLDIDKGGHTTVEAANAIYKSSVGFLALKMTSTQTKRQSSFIITLAPQLRQ